MFLKVSNKGQASIEILVAVIILFVFFASVIVYNSTITSDSDLIVSGITQRGNCTKLAYMISEVYSNGNGASTFFMLDESATVSSKRYVSIGSMSCKFLANTIDYSLSAGKITLTNKDNNVIITLGWELIKNMGWCNGWLKNQKAVNLLATSASLSQVAGK